MPSDLSPVDDELSRVLRDEREPQRETLSLIASENARNLVQGFCREFPLYEEDVAIVDA